MFGMTSLARAIFGSTNDRKVKGLRRLVGAVNALEPTISALSDAEIAAQTQQFRARLAAGETLDDLLPEAFATAREAASRALGMRPFDVQVLGGIVLHRGGIAEMKTGEGKTLVATMPVYLNALAGPVHVVTVNDYLARRDAEWMGRVYSFLGMTTGVIIPGLDDAQRRQSYACDITYATNNELGFDYLRDNMKYRLDDMVQRGHAYAIVDEVDSILIDEARTPLIISGPAQDHAQMYQSIDALIPSLAPDHFEIDEKQRTVTLTEEGNEAIEQLLVGAGLMPQGGSLYDPAQVSHLHHVTQALRAHKLFTRDKDYIVKSDKVIIIDEFTGRMMEGRRYGDGLHQALEAKERVKVQPENQTMASVTFQNYFRLYKKLAGMTGTALTEADEFMDIYKLDVIEVPTNRAVTRQDDDDQVFRTAREKFDAIVAAIREGQSRGQPILVGTTSIEKSETLSAELQKLGVPHQVLNARYHETEAQIIAQAGWPGAVTIATNMAGRGTDIQLGGNVDMLVAQAISGGSADSPETIRRRVEAEVAVRKAIALQAGGLWVIGTERHESRRIDNQLRGRSGRQGDPGRSSFFLSLQDDLMRIFGSERIDGILQKLGLEEGEAIVHSWVNKAIQKAQGKVEARNFDMRKNVLKYDDVMNDQRKAIFEQRREIMEAADLGDTVRDMRHSVIDELVSKHIPKRAYSESWEIPALADAVESQLGHAFPVADWAAEEGVDDEAIRDRLYQGTDEIYAQKEAVVGAEPLREYEKGLVLQVLDHHWREHLVMLDHLRSVIGLRGYGQRDPLNEFKSEAFQLFEALLSQLRHDVTMRLGQMRPMTAEEQAERARLVADMQARIEAQAAEARAAAQIAAQSMAAGDVAVLLAPERTEMDPANPATWTRTPRNAACPCGSGQKYKHCHGRMA